MNDIKKYYLSEAVAKEIGVEEAIMFSNIYFWVTLNQKKRSSYHYHNGKYWMFNSVTSFKEQFSFWTESAIRRILKNLESEGYLETGRFNKYGYDKTKWYTVTPKALCVAEKDNGLVETASSWSDS